MLKVDRALVISKGREAAGKLLVELQVRKSTADAAGAREFYTNLTRPISGWEGEIRNMVLHKKLVRNRSLSQGSKMTAAFLLPTAPQNICTTQYSVGG